MVYLRFVTSSAAKKTSRFSGRNAAYQSQGGGVPDPIQLRISTCPPRSRNLHSPTCLSFRVPTSVLNANGIPPHTYRHELALLHLTLCIDQDHHQRAAGIVDTRPNRSHASRDDRLLQQGKQVQKEVLQKGQEACQRQGINWYTQGRVVKTKLTQASGS
ncbi:hypothetical protein VTK56DRAFT_4588 [Thermocarpiscus australiensis]